MVNVLVVGAAAPTDKSFSLITFLAGKLLGRLSVPLIVIPGSFTDEEIIALTRPGVGAATVAPRRRGHGDLDDCAFVRGQGVSSAYTRRGAR